MTCSVEARAARGRSDSPHHPTRAARSFYFPDPVPSVVAALQIVEVVASEGLPPARVGIHAGPVVFQEGDHFGRRVNIAARILERAGPGEVLVSEEVVELAKGSAVTFTDVVSSS